MRERAEALGGGLVAGPGPDGGFTVRARLPL
jgi:signal transduction histidine kinase